MKQSIVPEAFFDSLSIGSKLNKFLDGFRPEEIHLFAYFSSILFLYNGSPVSNWGYYFQINSDGYPISDKLSESFERHLHNGLFVQNGSYFNITGRGSEEFVNFKSLLSWKKREESLEAACTTTILIPYSQAIRALLKDPTISKAHQIQSPEWLEQSYQRFSEISKAVGVPPENLLISAVTWVNYMDENKA